MQIVLSLQNVCHRSPFVLEPDGVQEEEKGINVSNPG